MTAKKKAYNNMTSGPAWKCLLLFALPIMAGQLLQQLYSTVDGIVVGNYISSGALAAVGTCTSVTFIFLSFSNGMANGSGVIISQFLGAGRKEDLRSAAANILLLLIGLSLIMTALGVGLADFITGTVLNIPEAETQAQAAIYLRIYCAGMIFTFVYNAVAAILRGVGDSKALLYFLLVSTGVNTVLDVVFVRFFDWGVAGAAWATVISQAACMVVSIWYMFRNYPDFRFTSVRDLKFDPHKMKLCLRLGIPTTLQQLIVSGGHLALQRLVNSFGVTTMAAVTVGSRFEHYAAIPSMGIMQGIASFSGQNIGAGKPERVKKGLRAAVGMNVGAVVVISIILYTLSDSLGKLFGVTGEELKQTGEYMRALSLVYPIFAFYFPMNGMFQGCGKPLYSAVVAFVALVGRVGGAYAMVYLFDIGYPASWNSYGIGWTMALMTAVAFYLRGKWKTASVVHQNGTEGET